MPGGAKADIKLGFWIGVGFLMLMLTLIIARMLVGGIRAKEA